MPVMLAQGQASRPTMNGGGGISIADVEPQLLRTFLTVADTGSFSVAAQRLGYTQSAVSQHIATLEADLGTPLLTRRPVALTEAGRRLRGHASLILVRMAAARADVTRAAAPPARLVVGLTPLAWLPVLAGALARIRAELVLVRAEVRVADRAQVLSGVAAGSVDLGLIDGYAAPSDPLRLPDAGLVDSANGGLSAVAVAESPVVVAMPATHPLAHRPGLALTDLAEAYWMDAPAVAPLSELRAAAGLDGLRAGLSYEGADVAVLLGLIAAGHGLAVLPQSVMTVDNRLAGVPVSAPRLVHRVEVLHSARGEPAAKLAAALT
jgi:DNA-binding transcriptional LysR family regulator